MHILENMKLNTFPYVDLWLYFYLWKRSVDSSFNFFSWYQLHVTYILIIWILSTNIFLFYFPFVNFLCAEASHFYIVKSVHLFLCDFFFCFNAWKLTIHPKIWWIVSSISCQSFCNLAFIYLTLLFIRDVFWSIV